MTVRDMVSRRRDPCDPAELAKIGRPPCDRLTKREGGSPGLLRVFRPALSECAGDGWRSMMLRREERARDAVLKISAELEKMGRALAATGMIACTRCRQLP